MTVRQEGRRRSLLSVHVDDRVIGIIVRNTEVLDRVDKILTLLSTHALDDREVIDLELLNDLNHLVVGPAAELLGLLKRLAVDARLLRTTTGEGGEDEGEQQVHDLPLEDDTRHGALHCTARCGLLLGFE